MNQAPGRVLGVLAGEDMPPSPLRMWAESADFVIAADGGANRLLRAGIRPQMVVGDMDSISSEARNEVPDVRPDTSQEITDCDKLLALALDQGVQALTLIGVEGDLPDHEITTLHSAARSPLDIRIAYRRGVGWIVRGPDQIEVPTTEDRRVSLIPITDCSGVALEGVRWRPQPNLSPLGFTSISNRATGDRVVAAVDKGVGLLFVEYSPAEVPFW